jgi:hypothetical protein
MGLLGSIVAIICGIWFFIEGIKINEAKGYLIGGGCILLGIIGIIICSSMLKKNKKQ